MGTEERGFTLIELLVVILIIAILAAIAVPVYLRQKDKGYETQVRAALRDAAIAVESYAVANQGDYSSLNADPQLPTRLGEQGFKVPPWATVFSVKSNQRVYCIRVRHARLTTTNAWHESVYQSWVGAPTSTPNDCPQNLPAT